MSVHINTEPSIAAFEGDGLIIDRKVAEALDKHAKTIKKWDKSERMLSLGWPPVVYVNGYGHRERPKLRTFMRNAAQAHLNKA
jgi:hypothetical protein